jgi:hypothetical protein
MFLLSKLRIYRLYVGSILRMQVSCLAIRMHSCTALQRIARKLRSKTVHQQRGRGLCVYFHPANSLTAIVSVRFSSMRITSRLSEHVINPQAIVYVDQTFERQFVIREFDSKYRQNRVGITNLDFTNKNIPSRH